MPGIDQRGVGQHIKVIPDIFPRSLLESVDKAVLFTDIFHNRYLLNEI
jgi:hypothetical protein